MGVRKREAQLKPGRARNLIYSRRSLGELRKKQGLDVLGALRLKAQDSRPVRRPKGSTQSYLQMLDSAELWHTHWKQPKKGSGLRGGHPEFRRLSSWPENSEEILGIRNLLQGSHLQTTEDVPPRFQ